MRRTELQQRFIEEFPKDCNATQAAIRAGYSRRSARQRAFEVLQYPGVQKAIAAKLAKISEKCEIDAAWVRKRLVENVERSMQKVPVLDDEGAVIGEWRYEGQVANGALKTLAQTLGMLIERREITGKDGDPLIPVAAVRAALGDLHVNGNGRANGNGKKAPSRIAL